MKIPPLTQPSLVDEVMCSGAKTMFGSYCHYNYYCHIDEPPNNLAWLLPSTQRQSIATKLHLDSASTQNCSTTGPWTPTQTTATITRNQLSAASDSGDYSNSFSPLASSAPVSWLASFSTAIPSSVFFVHSSSCTFNSDVPCGPISLLSRSTLSLDKVISSQNFNSHLLKRNSPIYTFKPNELSLQALDLQIYRLLDHLTWMVHRLLKVNTF